jgi:hypothetical protein
MQPTHLEDTAAPALPCAGGLIAGTLALMTCWAAPERSVHTSPAQQRLLMARKIASNLYFLREHPDIAHGMRQVIGKAHERWLLIAQSAPADNESESNPAQPDVAAANALH